MRPPAGRVFLGGSTFPCEILKLLTLVLLRLVWPRAVPLLAEPLGPTPDISTVDTSENSVYSQKRKSEGSDEDRVRDLAEDYLAS